MVPADFEQSNCVLDKPGDMSFEDCDPLNVWRGSIGDFPVVLCCWKLTAEELEEIKRTGRVWLMLWGQTMPPATVLGECPFEE